MRERERERGVFSLSNVDHPFCPARTLPSFYDHLSIIVAFTAGRSFRTMENKKPTRKKREEKRRKEDEGSGERRRTIARQNDLLGDNTLLSF